MSLAVPLTVGMLACSKEPEPSTPASSEGQLTSSEAIGNFTFAPPEGTRYVRKEHSERQVALTGTPIARRDEQELTWQVAIERKGDDYVADQTLTHVMMKQNGVTTLDADVAKGAIAARLTIDRDGKLQSISGLHNTSGTLRALAGGKLDPIQESAFSPESLGMLVATRYDAMIGDLVGHPVKPGHSWTSQGRPNSAITSRTFVVQRLEPCGMGSCARVREDAKLDPKAMKEVADVLIKRRLRELGADASAVETKNATYASSGTLQVDPRTTLVNEAAFAETGRVIASAGKSDFEITLSGTTVYRFDYARPPETVGSR